jgi:ligand-binding SRPBCC domain-containing protein
MPTIILETIINAPAEICFDLIRDVRIHTQTTSRTNEKAVAGVTGGKMGIGQTVTFEGKHLGMRQRMTVKVIEFERPRLFVDEMIEGTFAAFKHVHEFLPHHDGTLMRDTIVWTSPFGVLGRVVDKLLINRHLTALVSERNRKLKQLAEETALSAA